VPAGLSDRALALFAVPAEDQAGLSAAADAVRKHTRLALWVEQTAADLTAAVGMPSPPPALTARPEGEPSVVAYLPVLALVQVLPRTLSWAQERGIPASIVAATLRDVGRMLRRNRLWYGRPGLDEELAGWVPRHVIGSILEVGRLQYERSPAGIRTGAWLLEDGADYVPGDLAVNLHIPETGTPLDPASVVESLRAGRAVLRKRFPGERLRARFCVSWLLDPQLAEYLPQSSNLLAFQRRFRIGPAKGDDGDMSVRKFVFGKPFTPLEELPQRTSLERAAVAHWRAGRHWHVHVGRLP
jgi:hypothetical protein